REFDAGAIRGLAAPGVALALQAGGFEQALAVVQVRGQRWPLVAFAFLHLDQPAGLLAHGTVVDAGVGRRVPGRSAVAAGAVAGLLAGQGQAGAVHALAPELVAGIVGVARA